MDRLKDEINTLDLFARCRIGLLEAEDSMSILAMPGGAETVFMDGIRDKQYQIQINALSKDQEQSYHALTTVYQHLERLQELESHNDSFDFQGITVQSLPNLVGQDDQGYFMLVVNISAKITIYD